MNLEKHSNSLSHTQQWAWETCCLSHSWALSPELTPLTRSHPVSLSSEIQSSPGHMRLQHGGPGRRCAGPMGNPPSSWMASQTQPGCFRLVTEAVEETGRQETLRGGRGGTGCGPRLCACVQVVHCAIVSPGQGNPPAPALHRKPGV